MFVATDRVLMEKQEEIEMLTREKEGKLEYSYTYIYVYIYN